MDEMEKLVAGIIKFLRTSGKLDLLPEIIARLEQESNKLKGENTAVVTSSHPLTPEEEQEIERELVHLFGRKLMIINKVDPAIIGGFVVQVTDKVVDLSLNSYLISLEEKIRNETN